MFENELRAAERSYSDIERKVERVIRDYESKLDKISSDVKKCKGVVEKEIDDQIAELETEINSNVKQFQKEMEGIADTQKKALDEKQRMFLKQLQDHKNNVILDFNAKIKQLMIVKGEL